MAKKQNSALSELHRGKHTSTRSPERKILNTRLVNRGRIRSFENLAITKSFPSRQTDEPLREAEHFLSDIFASIQDGISILDKDMNIIRVNQTMERWYSHAMPLVGKKCYEAYHGRSERCNICPTHQTVLTGKAAHEVVPKVGPGGKIVGWLDLYSFPLIETSTEKMRGVIEYVRDITERKRVEEALLNAAQQWRATFDGISDIVCLLDKKGRIIRCNKAMTDFLGKTFGEIINHTHLEIVHGAQMPIEECPVERLWKTHHRETDIQLVNDRWFSIAVDPLLDEARRLVGAVHIMSDVTERKRAEEVIRESEKRYRQVIENAVDIIYTTDANGNFTHANPAALTTTGYSLEELQRFNYLDLILPEHRDRVSKILISQFRERQATTYVEFPFFNKSGDVLWFGQNASLVIEREKPIGFHVIARDITDRKRAEEALLESEEQYRLTFTNVSDVIYTINLNLVVSSVSPSVERILGYKVEELVNRPIQDLDLIPPEYLEKAFSETMRIFSGEQISNSIYEFIAKDGTRRIGEISSSPLHNNGKIVGSISVARDITERRKIEEALLESESKFRNLVENSIVGVYLVQDGVFKYVNSRGAEIHGYKIEEMIDKMGPEQLTLPEDWPTVEASIGKRVRGEEHFTHHEFRIFTKSRDIRNVEVFGARTIYQGRPAVLGTMLDVTERKKLDEKFTNLVTQAPIGLSTLNNAGTYEYVNPKFTEIFGYSLEDVPTGKIWFEKAHPDPEYRRMVLNIWKGDLGSAEAGKAPARVFIVTCKDGSLKTILFKHVRLTDEGHLVAYEDITDLKQAEEALHQSEEKYRTILENMAEGYFEVDLAGNITFVNDAECTNLGYSRQELMGMNNRQYTDKETAKRVFAAFNRIYRTGEPVKRLEEEVIRKDRIRAIRELSVTMIRDSAGKPVGFRAISRDITERKQAEQALQESEETANRLAQENAIVAEIGRIVSSTLNIEEVYERFAEEVYKLIPIDRISINTINPEDRTITLAYVFGIEVEDRKQGQVIPFADPFFEELIDRRSPVLIQTEDVSELAAHYPILLSTFQAGLRSMMSIPLISKDRVIGALHFRSTKPNAYSERDLGLAQRVGNQVAGAIANAQLFVERRRAEEALRTEQVYLEQLFESAQESIVMTDNNGIVLRANNEFTKLFGYTRDEAIGRSIDDLVVSNDKVLLKEATSITRGLSDGKAISLETIRHRKDETPISVSILASPIIIAHEQVGTYGIYRDITARKQAEEALRQSEERYRNILESIQDGYFENDLAGNFTFVNDVISRHLGYTKKELIGMNYRHFVDEENGRKLYQYYNGLYRAGQPVNPFEAEYIRKDGAKLIAEISVSLIRDLEGKPIGLRGISRDVTERKQAEQEKLSLQEQLRQAQKMEAIGQLAGGVAHDFNNLLTVIKGYSQLSLLDLKEDNSLWGNLQEIEKATQRATDLTRQLLAFSRRQILDLKVLDLNVLLKDLEKMLRRIIGEDIALVILLAEDLGKVKVDPSQIEQVIFNLAVNARDAMPSGGKLAIETANVELDEEYAHAHVSVTPGRYVRLSVSDTGVGMTQEVKERVFEPFFTTKEKGKGTGLGLSMVYGIVRQTNGNIWLYSEPGRGTTFRIYFPRTEEEADTLHEREEADFFPRGSETVLLVEDDELVRDLANRLLEQQGYRVLKAANGQEALRVAKEHVGETIHLLLADIVMPQMGGKELTDWLKISRPNVKVLYTSGYADNAIVHHGVLDPGTHFLQKPFSLKTLSHKVREILDG